MSPIGEPAAKDTRKGKIVGWGQEEGSRKERYVQVIIMVHFHHHHDLIMTYVCYNVLKGRRCSHVRSKHQGAFHWHHNHTRCARIFLCKIYIICIYLWHISYTYLTLQPHHRWILIFIRTLIILIRTLSNKWIFIFILTMTLCKKLFELLKNFSH